MEIKIDPANQFIYSLDQLFTDKNSYELTEDLKEYYNNLEGSISPLLYSDLKYFFKDSGLSTVLHQHTRFYESVNQYFKYLEILSEYENDKIYTELLSSQEFLRDTFKESGIEALAIQTQELYNNTGNYCNIKDGLTELYRYPKETILRYLSSLKRYYKEYYSKIEKEILEKLIIEREKLEKNMDNSLILQRELARIELEDSNLDEYDKCIFISYFPLSKVTISVNTSINSIVVIFNYKYIESLDPKKRYESSLDFIKVISDETRMKIIRLLASKKCYSTEIAKEVGLNRGTVSYHMDKLKKEDAIKYSFSKKRIYYSLHKERFKDMFDSFLLGLELLEKEENDKEE